MTKQCSVRNTCIKYKPKKFPSYSRLCHNFKKHTTLKNKNPLLFSIPLHKLNHFIRISFVSIIYLSILCLTFQYGNLSPLRSTKSIYFEFKLTFINFLTWLVSIYNIEHRTPKVQLDWQCLVLIMGPIIKTALYWSIPESDNWSV